MKIALLGDICLTGKFDLESNPDAFRQFEQIKPILAEYDYIIANLESPFTDLVSSRVCKSIHIKSPPDNTRLLQYLGVTAVNLANNHVFDYGQQGYRSTIEALDAADIRYFGTQGQTTILEKNTERLILGGFCCLSAHPSQANNSGVNTLSYASFRGFLDMAHAQGAFPLASVHWGDENIHYPREDHVLFARLMALKHTFLLHGHHPHVVQGLERCDDTLIAYSLGNFCTDEHVSWSIRDMVVRHTPENQQSFLLGVTVENCKILGYEVIPITDMGDSLVIQDQEALDNIAAYSLQLSSPYRRPRRAPATTPADELTTPTRFSMPWFLRRLNYHFIGAFLKGLINRYRYQAYFAKVRQKAADKGIC